MWDTDAGQFIPTIPAETNGQRPDEAAAEPPRRLATWADEHIPMTVVIGGAALATGLSAWGMWGFGVDILNMDPWLSAFSMGVLEIIMTGLALMARRDARRGLPTRSLMVGVIGLSTLSGALAALDELHNGNGYAAVFRLVLPLIVAWVWHHVLVGDRAHATGRTLADIRYGMSVNRYLDAWEDYVAGDTKWFGVTGSPGRRLTRAERGLAKRVPVDRIDTMVSAARAAREAASVSGKKYAVTLRQQRVTNADTTVSDATGDTSREAGSDMTGDTVSDTVTNSAADTLADTVSDMRPAGATDAAAKRVATGRATRANTAARGTTGKAAKVDKNRVRDLIAGGSMTLPEIAAETGASLSTVNRVKRDMNPAK